MGNLRALVLVDIQNDFLPGGTLAVPEGDQILPVVDRILPQFDLVVATQDWHPPNHGSFASNHIGKRIGDTIELGGLDQILWPGHCVQDTQGAEFAKQLNTQHIVKVFPKGTNAEIDSYSGFFDNGHKQATGMGDFLSQMGVARVYVVGLATDYCVKFTALDALELGFETYVIEDGCRGVDLNPGDVDRAIDEMRSAGINVVTSSELH